jgi:DNA helicase II / ATP-dependent DNA helicase PcrA
VPRHQTVKASPPWEHRTHTQAAGKVRLGTVNRQNRRKRGTNCKGWGLSEELGLNEAQNDAVNTLEGPMLVLAGAGTGKTRVVTSRVARLIRAGIEPPRILAVTFTNKAAEEMQSRIRSILGRQKLSPQISTFHSYCVGVLRRHIAKLGYPERFTIYSTAPQRTLAQRVLREAKLPGAAMTPEELIQRISRWKTQSVLPPEAAAEASSDRDHLAAVGYRRYQESLRSLGAVDFDDLLLLTQFLFQKYPAIRREEANLFDHVLIDEYQDTNQSQYRIVRSLAAGHRNLCVVGDDDQSIYSWRGAEVRHILGFRRDWPEAKVIRLEENYRSTAAILSAANRLIRFNKTRHPKQLRATGKPGKAPRVAVYDDDECEATDTVAEIRELIDGKKYRPKDIAVLFRTNEQPRVFETAFRKAGVPYVLVGGTSFFDRKEVQDVLAYVRLLVDPRDDLALLRVLNRPARGIGKETNQVLRVFAKKLSVPIWIVLEQHLESTPMTAVARAAAGAFKELISRHRDMVGKLPCHKLLKLLLDEVDYRREVSSTYPKEAQKEAHWGLVELLLDDLRRREKRTATLKLDEYLHDLALRERDFEPKKEKETQLKRDAVVLLTLHAAKGLEYPVVYLVGMEEGLLPHRKSIKANESAIEEERRLCYVGVTRAQQMLTLSLAKMRRRGEREVPTIPSRFLYELTGQEAHPDYARAVQGIG